MNIYGADYKFNGQLLSSFGEYIMVDFSGDTESVVNMGAGIELETTSISPYKSVKKYYAEKYNDILTFDISICLNDGSDFDKNQIRALNRWMQPSGKYRELIVIDYPDDDFHQDITYYAKCTDITYFKVANRIKGLTFSMTCNAPYGFEIKEYSFDKDNNILVIEDISDDDTYVKPIIEFHANQTGNVEFVNNMVNAYPLQIHCLQNNDYIIDNSLRFITDRMGMLNFDEEVNKNWIYLNPMQSNTIRISGDVSGKMTCKFPRKVGI